MHLLAYILFFAATSCCLAHYRGGYESHRMFERNELHEDVDGVLVECPVCESNGVLPTHEHCNIIRGNKKYKKCEFGTYKNEVCGNRRDCYRGPAEQCTEKMEIDVYGQKCAYGYYCDNLYNVCVGLDYSVERPFGIYNHLYQYPLRDDKLIV